MDPRGTMNYVQALVEGVKTCDKPIIVFLPMGGLREVEEKVLYEANLPVVMDGAEAVAAVNALIRYTEAERRFRSPVAAAAVPSVNVAQVRAELAAGPKTLTEHQAKVLLGRYGIPVTREEVATSATEAVRLANGIGYPVVMKVESADILHATDAGALKLNLRSDQEVAAAFGEIMANARKHSPNASIKGVLVQEMVAGGREVIVGMSRDPQFGPAVVFGLGGVLVEVLRDISMRVVPVTRYDAEDMVKEIKGYRLLQQFRGMAEADSAVIIDTILKVSRLAEDLGDLISEIDINPLIVLEKGRGGKAVDALVVLK